MNDDLARIFAQPAGTFRPPTLATPKVREPGERDRQDGGPHFALSPNSSDPADDLPSADNEADAMDSDYTEAPFQDDDPVESPDAGDCLPAPSGEYQLEAVGLAKSYRKASVEIPVLKGVDLAVRRGEFLAIVGQSGSGKSTLLHLLGTLDSPDEGSVFFEGRRIDNLPAAGRDLLRNRRFGMIFQFYHLLPELTTLENVLAPLMIGKSVLGFLRNRTIYRSTAEQLLELVGLSHRLKHTPRELSGGEMQRAAIARALVAAPDLLLADEPTGNLDQSTGQEILELLCSLKQRDNLTIVMVTHDQAIAQRADRIVRLVDGRIDGL
jgi:lipoprotein-releasing system ATP-binding protein